MTLAENEVLDQAVERQVGTFRVLSLFSGCGGMDLGAEGGFSFLGEDFQRLPTHTVGAVELDARIAEVYRNNFSTPCTVGDIREILASDLPKHDILTGGFPCQSFSISAQNPPRLGHDDVRGRLYFEMCRLLDYHRPKAFIAENVKGILTANRGQAFPLILEEFERSGYHVNWALLNAADYGVPQRRQRVFLVGFRSAVASRRFTFPEPTRAENPAVLGDVVLEPSEVDESFFFSQRALDGLAATKLSKIMKKGRVQDPREPCNTVSAHLAKVSINSTDPVFRTRDRLRMFTPREVARIQSFPENFQLPDVKTVSYRALGNAVPPVLMWYVTRQVLGALTAPQRGNVHRICDR